MSSWNLQTAVLHVNKVILIKTFEKHIFCNYLFYIMSKLTAPNHLWQDGYWITSMHSVNFTVINIFSLFVLKFLISCRLHDVPQRPECESYFALTCHICSFRPVAFEFNTRSTHYFLKFARSKNSNLDFRCTLSLKECAVTYLVIDAQLHKRSHRKFGQKTANIYLEILHQPL